MVSQLLRSSATSSESRVTPRFSFMAAMAFELLVWSSQNHVGYICANRRKLSQTNRGLPVFLIIPSATASFNQVEDGVHLPGIDTLAPDLTDTRSGLDGSPTSGPSRIPAWRGSP